MEKSKQYYRERFYETTTISSHGTIVHHSAHDAHFLCGSLCSLWLKPPPASLSSNLPEAEATSSPASGAARCRTSGGGGRAGARTSRRLGNAFGNCREVGGRAARAPAKTQNSALYSGERPWCQTPSTQEVVEHGLVFDRVYRINRIEGDGKRNAEGAEITRRARRGKGNSDWWQGYANAPPAVMASVTLRDFRMAFGIRHPRATI